MIRILNVLEQSENRPIIRESTYHTKAFCVLYLIVQTRVRLTIHEVTEKQAENNRIGFKTLRLP